jgi:putative DNA methylase
LGADKAEAVKDLAYCLYDICSQQAARGVRGHIYNALIAVWSELSQMPPRLR